MADEDEESEIIRNTFLASTAITYYAWLNLIGAIFADDARVSPTITRQSPRINALILDTGDWPIHKHLPGRCGAIRAIDAR